MLWLFIILFILTTIFFEKELRKRYKLMLLLIYVVCVPGSFLKLFFLVGSNDLPRRRASLVSLLPYSSTFFAETLHMFPTYQCLQKGVWDFFILFRSWVIKNVKRPAFYALVFYIFINNSRSKQNQKNPRHPFVDIGK